MRQENVIGLCVVSQLEWIYDQALIAVFNSKAVVTQPCYFNAFVIEHMVPRIMRGSKLAKNLSPSG
jgi:hypothetical protein